MESLAGLDRRSKGWGVPLARSSCPRPTPFETVEGHPQRLPDNANHEPGRLWPLSGHNRTSTPQGAAVWTTSRGDSGPRCPQLNPEPRWCREDGSGNNNPKGTERTATQHNPMESTLTLLSGCPKDGVHLSMRAARIRIHHVQSSLGSHQSRRPHLPKHID